MDRLLYIWEIPTTTISCRLIFHNITTHGDNGPAHRKMSDGFPPMTATVTPVHRGETSSRARFPKASSAHHCQALSSCHVELVNSTDLTPISWRIGVKNVNTAIFTTLHLCEFSRDHQIKNIIASSPSNYTIPRYGAQTTNTARGNQPGVSRYFGTQNFQKSKNVARSAISESR